MNKKYIVPLFLGFLLLGVFLIYSFGSLPLPINSVNGGIAYNGYQYTYTTGDFEGRKTPAHQGIMEEVPCEENDDGCHNVLFDSGANMTRNCLTLGACYPISNISLCNATTGSGCGDPTSAGTELFTLYNVMNLSAGEGIIYPLGQTGNWTVSKLFVATGQATTNVTRIGNGTNYFAGNSFTLVTLQANDQLTINWTLAVS